MDGDNAAIRHLIITGVNFSELAKGGYRRVFTVTYSGVTCAAKKICVENVSLYDRARIKQKFLQECLLHSKLHHP